MVESRTPRRGRELGFGAGIAQGYATLGQIGFADRSGYTAVGTVCNLATGLCAEGNDGQILVAQGVAVSVVETTMLEEMGACCADGGYPHYRMARNRRSKVRSWAASNGRTSDACQTRHDAHCYCRIFRV
jgi:class 3 adenylate cyclase